MSRMSGLEAAFCRSAPWRAVARRVVLPWACDGATFGREVLEIGGGSGAMADELLRREPGIERLHVVDVDPAMVAKARHALAGHGGRAAVRITDARRLPFADASVDSVVSWLMLHHTVDADGVAAEIARVLRPNGTLVGYDLAATAAARALHRVTRSEVRFLTADDVTDALTAHGLVDVTITPAAANHLYRFRARRPGPGEDRAHR